ncbi:hypothetical protein GCM10019016_139700 [Streptomyces prasinosporus]|uniref:Uncharacterized protein n=1 Tax=Streptomyces prasinosporus TaxID=68256 RepID=A0ABP6UIX2_9ACTN
MPLDTQDPGGRREFDRLHRAVLRVGRREQALAQAVHRLVVEGRHGGLLRDEPGVARARHRLDRVTAEDARRPGVTVDVLDERAPEGDVQQLHPPADPQQRETALQGRPDQRELPGVPRPRGRSGAGVGLGAVADGLHVRAARDHQAVEPRHDRRGVLRRVRREHRGQSARPLHQQRIAGRQQRGVQPPRAPAHAGLRVRADADQRPGRRAAHLSPPRSRANSASAAASAANSSSGAFATRCLRLWSPK